MKKIINITIGTIVFSIEDDAYEKLSNYLAGLRNHFGEAGEGKEIIEDIESSIAEKFQSREKRNTPISVTDVESVIATMGTVHDFKDFEADAMDNEESRKGTKRLYRDSDDRIVAGVASGIAAFFGIDPVIVRIIFVLLAFANGFGILAYIVLWLIMPKASTTAQKLEMQGEVVTIQKISEFVEENFEKIKKKDNEESKAKQKVKYRTRVLNANRSIVHGIGSFFRILIGIVFSVAGSVGIVALTFGSFTLLIALPVAPADPTLQVVVDTFFGEDANSALIVAAYFIVFIPLIMLLLGGVGMLRKKTTLSIPLTTILAILWFYALISLLVFGADNVSILQERVQELREPNPITTDLQEIDELFDELLDELGTSTEK